MAVSQVQEAAVGGDRAVSVPRPKYLPTWPAAVQRLMASLQRMAGTYLLNAVKRLC